MAGSIPPLPAGFTLDASPQQDMPALPPGFTLDSEDSQGAYTTAQRAIDPSLYDKTDQFKNAALRIAREGTRRIGRIGLNLAEGGLGLPQFIGNAVAGAVDKGLEAAGSDYRLGRISVTDAVDPQGYLAPQNEAERYEDAITRGLMGAATGVGVGGLLARSAAPVVAGVGNTLAASPGIQAVSAGTGATSSQFAKESGAGPVAQTLAGLAGSLAPATVASGTQSLTRGAFRGGEQGRQRLQENIQSFARAGTSPSVGQATQGRVARATESMLSRTPGGAGPVVARAESQADEIASAIEQRASKLVRSSSAEQAGRNIERGVRGPGGFVDRFKAEQKRLYDELDRFIPPATGINVDRTQAALKQLNQTIDGAENVSRLFQNAKIKGIESALKEDLKAGADRSMVEALTDGKLPYEAVKKLRTLVGNEITDGLSNEVPRSKFKTLYAALSDDLGQAAEANPGAKAAWNRANNYTRAGMRRLEAIESVVDRSGGPEAIFKAATSGTKEGATSLRSVMQSLDTEGQKVVSATVLRRLGLAKAGVQGELGDRFSTESFLTNWNLLSPEAKRALFDRYGPTFRQDMDAVAKVAANLRDGSQVFKNPSGTGQATTQATTVAAFALSVVTGQVGPASAIAAGVTGSNLLARLMVNPRFVRWLAVSTKAPASATPALINRLAQQSRDTKDEELAQGVILLREGQNDQQQQDQRRSQR